MVYLNEFFPNPKGVDTKGEFIELFNSGDGPVSLGGWRIKTEKGKAFSLTGYSIPAHGYLLLGRAQTKLSLANTNGGLALYDAHGMLTDEATFLGSAPEGESFSRVDYATSETEHYAFVGPTPGSKNKAINNTIASKNYPLNVPLNGHLAFAGFFAIIIGTAALIAGLIIYSLKSHEDLSKLFFRRDDAPRGEDG